MVTDNISKQTSERLWQFLSAALFALGSIWLQNQFNMMQELQTQIIDLRKEQTVIAKELDSRYVSSPLWNTTVQRLNNLEIKIDRLLENQNGNGRSHTHDETKSGGR